MSNEVKLSDVLLGAVGVVLSRDGDVSTDGGCFACVDIGSIINLESGISKFFDLDSDDVTFSSIPIIKAKLDKYEQLVEENKRLREAMGRLISSGVSFQNLDEMDNTLDSDDIASIEAKFNDELILADKLLSELDGEK